MIIGILKETADHENRVALVPDIAANLIKSDHSILAEKSAGLSSGFPDSFYAEKGVELCDRKKVLTTSDLILCVQTPPLEDLSLLKEGTILISFLWALQNKETVEFLKDHKITALGMDAVPRISRAQNMDALSSMSNIAGYRSALIAAETLDKYLPMMMTAAGTIPPAKALVLGAGVAGLQAIATCKRLGAVVEAFDVRPAVKEQVQSLGAKFIEVPLEEENTETKGGYAKELSKDNQQRQREVIHEHAKKSDIIITTALIPGRPAPVLITREMVADMKPGSVIVDLAAENGGNCELTEAGKTMNVNEIKIVGPINVPSQLPHHASQLYSKNIENLLKLLIPEGSPVFNFEDEIILNTTITHQGEIISPMLKEA